MNMVLVLDRALYRHVTKFFKAVQTDQLSIELFCHINL